MPGRGRRKRTRLVCKLDSSDSEDNHWSEEEDGGSEGPMTPPPKRPRGPALLASSAAPASAPGAPAKQALPPKGNKSTSLAAPPATPARLPQQRSRAGKAGNPEGRGPHLGIMGSQARPQRTCVSLGPSGWWEGPSLRISQQEAKQLGCQTGQRIPFTLEASDPQHTLLLPLEQRHVGQLVQSMQGDRGAGRLRAMLHLSAPVATSEGPRYSPLQPLAAFPAGSGGSGGAAVGAGARVGIRLAVRGLRQGPQRRPAAARALGTPGERQAGAGPGASGAAADSGPAATGVGGRVPALASWPISHNSRGGTCKQLVLEVTPGLSCEALLHPAQPGPCHQATSQLIARLMQAQAQTQSQAQGQAHAHAQVQALPQGQPQSHGSGHRSETRERQRMELGPANLEVVKLEGRFVDSEPPSSGGVLVSPEQCWSGMDAFSEGEHVLSTFPLSPYTALMLAPVAEAVEGLIRSRALLPVMDGRASTGPPDKRLIWEAHFKPLLIDRQGLRESDLEKSHAHGKFLWYPKGSSRKYYDRDHKGNPACSFMGGFKTARPCKPGQPFRVVEAGLSTKLKQKGMEAVEQLVVGCADSLWAVFAAHEHTAAAAQHMLQVVGQPPYAGRTLGSTGWNAYTVNFDFRTALHTDSKNVPGSYSALCVLEWGRPFSGCHYLLPQYGLALDARGSVVFHRSGERPYGWHANSSSQGPLGTGLGPGSPQGEQGAHRVSIIFFLTHLVEAQGQSGGGARGTRKRTGQQRTAQEVEEVTEEEEEQEEDTEEGDADAQGSDEGSDWSEGGGAQGQGAAVHQWQEDAALDGWGSDSC